MWGPRESQGARSGPGSSAASLTLRLRLPRWTGCGRQDWHCQARVAITWGRELAFEVGTAPAWASLEAPTLLQLLPSCCSSYPAAAAPTRLLQLLTTAALSASACLDLGVSTSSEGSNPVPHPLQLCWAQEARPVGLLASRMTRLLPPPAAHTC